MPKLALALALVLTCACGPAAPTPQVACGPLAAGDCEQAIELAATEAGLSSWTRAQVFEEEWPSPDEAIAVAIEGPEGAHTISMWRSPSDEDFRIGTPP